MDNGTRIYDRKKISESWCQYYSDLHTQKSKDRYDDDDEYHQSVLDTLARLTNTYLANDDIPRIFTSDQVQQKCRKAAGIDNVTGENLKYAGKITYHALKTLFNSITKHKYVPNQFKRAMLIPIPKGKKLNKVLSDKDNYRGISLIPVLAKVYEQLLADWFRDDIGSLSSLQGAAQEKCPSLHSTMLLREVIQYNVFHGSTVYVSLLDVRKAYDTVGYDGLFHKLYQLKCNNILWQVLRSFYEEFRSCMLVNGVQSPWFDVLLGAPLSMRIYT